MVGRRSCSDGLAEVLEVLGHRPGRRRQSDEAGLAESVVDVLIGLVTDRVGGERLRRPGRKGSQARGAPEPRLALER